MNPHYQDDHTTLHHGDCIDVMRTMPENSIDAIVTDPPYGLGFMGKKWDALPPGEDWARECLRVLKPGGHILAFGGSKTWHRLAVAVEDAGFEIRDSIMWLYGMGFPKHRTGLKPAFEPVVMGRKPYKGSLTGNEADYGTGALNIDASRIRYNGKPEHADRFHGQTSNCDASSYGATSSLTPPHAEGRWPANVILDEFTADLVDEQSGLSTGVAGGMKRVKGIVEFQVGIEREPQSFSRGTADFGGASRFFYIAKAPKRERPRVDGVVHPTVKPLTLMRHLVKLVTPVGGTVLDTFAGSGTTIEAAILEGYKSIGIEREAEYLPLIEARIARAKPGNQETLGLGEIA